jgi:hypothetical protein
MNYVEIFSPTDIEYIRISVDQQLITEGYNCKTLTGVVNVLPATVEVEFSPFKIKPVVRYNNFMLDYWLANIQLFDHKLEFTITDEFFQNYKNKNMQGRIDSLSESQKGVDHYWDKYIGINNLHPDIIQQIKKLINQ